MSGSRPPLLPGDSSGVGAAANALRSGAIVAIPTDTVYGLAAALDRPEAINRLYTLKGRPEAKPIPVLIADAEDANLVCPGLPPLARMLADRFWPGALTLVVPALATLHPALTAADVAWGVTVAIRVPAHDLARQVIARAGGALAVTSANRSGDDPAVAAQEVAELGSAAPDMVLDGGRAPGGVASTVLLAAGDHPQILREGAISAVTIAAAVPASNVTNRLDGLRGESGV